MAKIEREPTNIKEDRQQWADHIPKIYQATYRKAMKGKSLRAAINAKCQDCTNWQRAEVRDCLVKTCPLYPCRPYQHKSRPPRGRLEQEIDVGTVV